MVINYNYDGFGDLISRSTPFASSTVLGNTNYPDLKGKVLFYQAPKGVVVVAEIENLPKTETNIFAFHIHDGENCEFVKDEYINIGEHYNPTNTSHPKHAGDLPPLFSNNGLAWMAVLTDRFEIKDVVDKFVIIHANPDDFTTQPSGNSGEKIACGIIKI